MDKSVDTPSIDWHERIQYKMYQAMVLLFLNPLKLTSVKIAKRRMRPKFAACVAMEY